MSFVSSLWLVLWFVASVALLVGPCYGLIALSVWAADAVAPGVKALSAALSAISVLSWAGIVQAAFPALVRGERLAGTPRPRVVVNAREIGSREPLGGYRGE